MPDMTTQLMDSEELKGLLEQAVIKCENKLVFISAYITQVAVDWLSKRVPDDVAVHLICRLQPFDIINGSTHLSALVSAIENDWAVSCLHSLHAKIYSIDNKIIYTGSANFTSNGLKIYGVGNIEASVKVAPSHENLAFIDKVCLASTHIDKNTLIKMQEYIEGKTADISAFKWPVDIIDEREGVWAQDFFWTSPGADTNERDHIHDLEILGIKNLTGENGNLKEKVLSTRCIQWLINTLEKEPNHELYFGRLSKMLHDDLKDDPAPYRKDVKILIQNMLAYSEKYLSEYIEISRPNHSQLIKLK